TDTLVRTGTGSIDVFAANDITLRNSFGGANPRQGTVVYSAGVRQDTVPVFPVARGIAPVLTESGGGLRIVAGRDVRGSDGSNLDGSNQSVNEWLWRGGVGSDVSPAVMWVNF